MGVYLSEPNTVKDTHTDQSPALKWTSCQMQGWRKNMEDARICDFSIKVNNKNYAVFGVFDGHGGFEVSSYVERHFIKQLLKNQQFNKGNIGLALEQNFRKMDQLLQSPENNKQLMEIRKKRTSDSIQDHGELISNNAGCTANVIVIDDTHYYCANSGDSRSVLCRGNGKIASLSEDHKPECEIERKRIQNAGGNIFNGRVNGGLNLTRALGDLQYKKVTSLGYKQQMITCHPDIIKIPRQPQDQFILMGCDGIWQRYVTDSQPLIDIVSQKRKHQNNSKVLMQNLLDSLLAKSTFEQVGCDNMTAILVEIKK